MCLKFSIQKINLDDFQHSFLTDKYITTIEWYRIYRNIRRSIENFKSKLQCDNTESEELNIYNLKMKYKFLPTEGCTANLLNTKAKYYMDIKITRQEFKKTVNDEIFHGFPQEIYETYIPKEISINHIKALYSPSKSNTKTSEDQYHPEPQNNIQINTNTYVPSKNSPTSIKDEYLPTSTDSNHDKENEKYTPSKIVEREVDENVSECVTRRTHKKIIDTKLPSKRNHSSKFEALLNLRTRNLVGKSGSMEEPSLLSSESDESENNKRQKIIPFVKISEKEQSVCSSSPSASNWLSKMNSNKLKNSFRIPKKNGTTSSTKTRSESSRARDNNVIPEESMNKVDAFLKNMKQDMVNQKKRKKELKGLEMLHCKEVTNEVMKK